MPFEIILAPEAIEDLGSLKAAERALLRDSLEIHLRHEPTKVSRSRIKKLKKLLQPQYRLRVGDFRVFYDVVADEQRVEVLVILLKSEATEWLDKHGKPEPESK